MSITQNKLIKYKHLQTELSRIKKEEAELRQEIADELLAKQPAGTHNFKFGSLKVKAVKKFNYSLDKDLLEALYDDFSEQERNCIRFKPELSMSEYKKFEEHHLLDQIITVKPAMPSITVISDSEE